MSWPPIDGNPVVRAALEPSLPFRARVSHAPAWDRLTLEGELDLASAPILEAELDRLEGDPASVIVVDLHRLSFIDAAGVRVLLQAHERALARKLTEITVALKPVPHVAFRSDGAPGVQPNQIVLTVQPDEGVSVPVGAKIPGRGSARC